MILILFNCHFKVFDMSNLFTLIQQLSDRIDSRIDSLAGIVQTTNKQLSDIIDALEKVRI